MIEQFIDSHMLVLNGPALDDLIMEVLVGEEVVGGSFLLCPDQCLLRKWRRLSCQFGILARLQSCEWPNHSRTKA
jgi:hypothetical protein